MILSGLVMTELEWERLLARWATRSSSKICSVFARTEECGARTVQFIGWGHGMMQFLLRGAERSLQYSMVDDSMISFVVEEILGCPLGDSLGGTMLTLLHVPSEFYKPPSYGTPSVRQYDARVSGRRVLGSRGLEQTCKELKKCLTNW